MLIGLALSALFPAQNGARFFPAPTAATQIALAEAGTAKEIEDGHTAVAMNEVRP